MSEELARTDRAIEEAAEYDGKTARVSVAPGTSFRQSAMPAFRHTAAGRLACSGRAFNYRPPGSGK